MEATRVAGVVDLTGTPTMIELVVDAIAAIDRVIDATPRGHRARAAMDDAIVSVHDARRELERAPAN